MKRRLQAMGIVVLMLVLSLGGCAKKDKSSDMKADTGSVENGFKMEETATSESSTVEAPAQMDVADVQAENGEKAINNENTDGSDYQQKLIHTVFMSIETEYFDDTVEELDQLCDQMKGYVGSSYLRNASSERSYSIELRIPQENLDQFLDQVSVMGRMKITSKKVSTEDITLDYYDSADHKKSLEVERDRILDLIAQADSLEYVVDLEDKLGELRYQISSYESQLRRMDSQVSYSTVNLEIYEVKQITVEEDATVGERIASGLKKNLNNLKEALVNFMVWFVTSLPNLILIGVVIFIGVKIVLRILNKDKGKNQKDDAKDKKDEN